jgi:hypothetical protein
LLSLCHSLALLSEIAGILRRARSSDNRAMDADEIARTGTGKINRIRDATLRHHISQGTVWLEESAGGFHTTAMSYAAFEYRLAVERLAVHYWAILLGPNFRAKYVRDIQSFDRVQNRIYKLAGNQLKIDRQFEFMRIIFALLKLPGSCPTPHIGKHLAASWHTCSDLCHIGWTLGCSVPEFRADAFAKLQNVRCILDELVSGIIGWPTQIENHFAELRREFVEGRIDESAVRANLNARRLPAVVEYPDGRSELVGETTPTPNIDSESV